MVAGLPADARPPSPAAAPRWHLDSGMTNVTAAGASPQRGRKRALSSRPTRITFLKPEALPNAHHPNMTRLVMVSAVSMSGRESRFAIE